MTGPPVAWARRGKKSGCHRSIDADPPPISTIGGPSPVPKVSWASMVPRVLDLPEDRRQEDLVDVERGLGRVQGAAGDAGDLLQGGEVGVVAVADGDDRDLLVAA